MVRSLCRRLGCFELRSLALSLVMLAGCGGGGSDEPVAAAPPCNAVDKVCYVSMGGNDANTGADPGNALATIRAAAERALSDYTIIVQAGTYRGTVTTASTGQSPNRLRFSAAGRVVVDVQNIANAAGFTFSNSDGTVIDGFTVIGAADAGIVIKSSNRDGSDSVVIRNCTVTHNPGDGIRIQDSPNVLVFNNLIYNNNGIGVRIGGTINGSANAEIINNTIYNNGGRGIEIGTTRAPSPSASVLNNIVQMNSRNSPLQDNIKVETEPPSYVGYVGDYNLVFPPVYVPTGANGIRGDHDVNSDAQFLDAAVENLRLLASSPAIDAGEALANRADLRAILRRGTTTGTNLDTGSLDIGFHY